MTYAEQLRADYAAIRQRLYSPSHAKPDPLPLPICRDIKVEKEEEEKSQTPRKIVERHNAAARRRLYQDSHLEMKNSTKAKWIDIANRVSAETGVSYAEIVSKHKTRRIVKARDMFCYLLKTEITFYGRPASHKWIGSKMGGRDHTCVINGLRNYCKRNNLPYPKS